MNRSCLAGRVRGRVQGVSYRAFARSQALAHSVHGYARNLADGSVEVLLCGDEHDVRHVVTLLHQGPPHARVDAIEWSPAAWRDGDGFEVG